CCRARSAAVSSNVPLQTFDPVRGAPDCFLTGRKGLRFFRHISSLEAVLKAILRKFLPSTASRTYSQQDLFENRVGRANCHNYGGTFRSLLNSRETAIGNSGGFS